MIVVNLRDLGEYGEEARGVGEEEILKLQTEAKLRDENGQGPYTLRYSEIQILKIVKLM